MNFEKVGLVLSGGGTKGIAHAGVLKFLKKKTSKSIYFPAVVQDLLLAVCML